MEEIPDGLIALIRDNLRNRMKPNRPYISKEKIKELRRRLKNE
jgi:hypothetical protein